MKKYFTFGLILSLVSGACFAQHPRVEQLLQEKQQKMDKLQKCKGTTKDLKIAGISTLSITAVGVGANIAEAVVLSDKKGDIKDAKKKYEAEKTIKENREAAEKKAREEALKKAQEEREAQKVLAEKCEELSGKLSASKNTCNVTKTGMTSDEMNKAVEQELKTFAEEEVFNCRDDKKTPKRTLTCTDNHKNTINLVYESSVAAPVAATKTAEATKPADKKAETKPAEEKKADAAKTADKKPAEKKVEEKKAEVIPEPEDKKPDDVSEQKKIDDAFLKACTGEYKATPNNSGVENSCTIHVKAPVSKADMESVATDKKLDDTVCPNDKVYDSGTKAKMFNCATGTMPNRLYVIFDKIKTEAPATTETQKAAAEEEEENEAELLQDLCSENKDYEYLFDMHGCSAKADVSVSVTSADQIDVQLDKLDDYWVDKGFDCTTQYRSDGDVREFYWECNKDGVEGVVFTQSVKMDFPCPEGVEFDFEEKKCNGAEAPAAEETPAGKTPEEQEADAAFAKLCEEYGHGAKIDSNGECTSDEFKDIEDIEKIEEETNHLSEYWVDKDGFKGNHSLAHTEEGDFVKYYYTYTYGEYIVNTAGVKVAKSICGEGNTFDADDMECISNEKANAKAAFAKLCEEYGHGASVNNDVRCDNEEEITDKELDQVSDALDELSKYWTDKEYGCTTNYNDYEEYWYNSCVSGDFIAYTPQIKIEQPCDGMGGNYVFDALNFRCSCADNYKEDADGKCEKVDCAENEFFDNSDKTCKECPNNQAAAAGDNMCKPFNCPHTKWQYAKGHKCQWFSTNQEEIDRFKRGEGVEHEYESVDEGMKAIYAFDEMFKSCECKPEPGTPHTVAWEDDYISCTCKDGAGVSKTIRFVFEDLED